jgi:hypothetical protein
MGLKAKHMVWHIFKKDWKLLWQLVVGLAAIHLTTAWIIFRTQFGAEYSLSSLLELFMASGYLGTACLIAVVVHQDALPGVRQDWLTRPVRRRDLLLAKFLFVLLFVQGPVILGDLVVALADGFSLTKSLVAATARGIFFLLGFTLPVLAFASLTSQFAEAVVGGLGAFLGIAGFIGLSDTFREAGLFDPTKDTGISWVPASGRFALLLVGASAVLVVQYYRRKTLAGRGLLVGVILLCLMTEYLPWQAAFAIEHGLSKNPGAGSGIMIAFEPRLGKARSPSGLSLNDAAASLLLRRFRRDTDTAVYLPLRISGLAPDVVLKGDRGEVRVVDPDGHATRLGPAEELEVFNDGTRSGDAQIYHAVHVRGDLYEHLKDRPVRLEIDYSLTLMRLLSAHAVPALNGEQRIEGVGWCKTRMNNAGTAILFGCLEAGRTPHCGSVFLENVTTRRRNPMVSDCDPDYAPYFGDSFIYDAMGRFGATLPFRDATGLTHYPVDGERLPDSHVVLRAYEAADHFSRRLVVPEIRLKDWQAE